MGKKSVGEDELLKRASHGRISKPCFGRDFASMIFPETLYILQNRLFIVVAESGIAEGGGAGAVAAN